jgi:ferredoxin--NADP+ reductase
MFKILDRKDLATSIKQFVIDAPLVAKKAKPGSSRTFPFRLPLWD